MANKDEHSEFVKDTIAGIQAMGIVFYGERIAIMRDPEKAETEGGIIIPDTAQKKEPVGTVVGFGTGISLLDESRTAGMFIGDRVMYTKYNPIDFFIKLPDGRPVKLEVIHVTDLYIGWKE